MSGAETFLSLMGTLWTIFIWTWWLVLIIALFAMKKTYERWPIDVVIIEKRGENLIKTNDRIGRVFDKQAEMTYYKIRSNGDTIPVYNFDWVLHNADKPTNIFEKLANFLRPTSGTAFLFRYGSKQYKPINITQSEEGKESLQLTKVKDKDGEDVFVYSYNQFDPRWVLGVLDFEVVDWDNMNFMIQEQRASAIRRAKRGDFWKQFGISAMILGVTALVALLILKFSADAGAELRGGAGVKQVEGTGGVIGGAINDVVTPPGE